MTVISRKALTDFSKEQPGSSDALLAWFRITCESDWRCFGDIKETFNSVDYAGNDLLFLISAATGTGWLPASSSG